MSFPLNTPELIGRIERFHTTFGITRIQALAALPGIIKTMSPLLRGKNRVGNVTAADLDRLDEVLALFERDGLQPSLSVLFGQLKTSVF